MTEKKLFLYTVTFMLALFVHLIGLNSIGRTWDEQYKVDFGVIALDRVASGDFSLDAWNQGAEHPMVAKYLYGALLKPGLILLKTAPNNPANITNEQIIKIQTGSYLKTIFYDRLYAVPYDFTLPRLLSVLCNTLAILLVTILAGFFIENIWWRLLPGAFLMLTARFVYLGQLVTFESISVFLFSLILLAFHKLLENPKKTRQHVLVGILCGLFFWTRYNNIVIFPLLLGWMGVHYYYNKQRSIFTLRLLLIPLIAFLLGILIWPLTWHEFPKYLLTSFSFHEKRFVGLSMYYWKYFFVTTPIPFLLGIPIGIYYFIKEKTYWQVVILFMMGFLFVIHSVLVFELGGTRYLVILYPLLALTAAYGYYKVVKTKYAIIMIFILLFMVFDMTRFYPYYLDYYNQLIGGAPGAIRAGYEFSWWGEGQKEAAEWINENAPNGSTVGLIVTPKYVFPALRNGLINKENVDAKSTADVLAISRSDANRLPTSFFQTHQIIYRVYIDNEWLVEVAKKK